MAILNAIITFLGRFATQYLTAILLFFSGAETTQAFFIAIYSESYHILFVTIRNNRIRTLAYIRCAFSENRMAEPKLDLRFS